MSYSRPIYDSVTLELMDEASQFKDAVIMMIDDELLVMEILQAFLEEQGYQNFILIDDALKAIDAVDKEQPDVLLLDLKMPGRSGYEILEELRQNPATKYLPVIVLTSSSDAATKLKVLELGATDFLAKPVDSSELALRLRNTLTVKAYQDQLVYYDALTKLPNRKLFLERLNWSMSAAQRTDGSLAVMRLVIDQLQTVHDTLGPNAGDKLIELVAERLVNELRNSDMASRGGLEADWRNIARLSAGEFSILLTDVARAERLSSVAKRLQQVLKAVFDVDGHEVFITVSIGISVYPDDATDADSLMKNASAAIAYAKINEKDSHQFYSKQMDSISKERLSMEAALRKTLESDGFNLHYQPQIDSITGTVVGMEALLRWSREGHGMVPPDHFIPLAEELGLISAIGEWVIYKACAQNACWHQSGLPGLRVSVNISAYQFRGGGLPATLADALDSSGLAPKQLMAEITESMLVGNIDRNIDLLHRVKDVGVGLSIDDFGTGYSSLNYLKRFPVDELKIDRSFVMDVPDQEQDAAIIKAIIALAKCLKLSVVAEGVETLPQLEYLRSAGCDLIQGFYYSKARPAEDFLQFCQNFNAKTMA